MTQLLEFVSRHSTSGSRANALGSAMGLLTLMSGLLLAAIHLKAPTPVLVTLHVFVGVAFFVCCGAFIYFVLKNPDSLRSERYHLTRLRIENGVAEGAGASKPPSPLKAKEGFAVVPPRRVPSQPAVKAKQRPKATPVLPQVPQGRRSSRQAIRAAE